MMESLDIALLAIAAGLLASGSFVSGYYTGRKDRKVRK